jgi:hypothetical protein
MTSYDKRQFLDPISSISTIILLHFSPSGTKISINDHKVQIPEYTHWLLGSLYRRANHDSRNDICYLYPIFVRFIELYLIEKQKKTLPKSDGGKPLTKITSIDGLPDVKLNQEEICYKYLKKLGEYAIKGMIELQKTYGYDNASFTLQCYINLLKEAIECRYTENSLPGPLKELTKNNLFDDTKIQKIWEDSHVIELGKTFEQCFVSEANKDQLLLNANIKKIKNILEAHDAEFKKMLGTDLGEV